MSKYIKVVGTTINIVLTDGTSSKDADLPVGQEYSNMYLTDLLFTVPPLETTNKTARLKLSTERSSIIYDTTFINAANAKTYRIPLHTSLMGVTALEISTDEVVSGDKTFSVELQGIGKMTIYLMRLSLSNEHPFLLNLEQEGNG